MKKWTPKENIDAFIGFLIFIGLFVFAGWILGVYKNDIRSEGYVEVIYHKPSGERNY